VPTKNRNRVLAVLAAAAVAGILAALYRRSGTFAEVDTGTLPPAQGFYDEPALIGNAPVTPVTAEPLPEIPAGIFDGGAVVERGDTVWSLIKEKLSTNSEFVALDEERQAYVVDEYKDFLQSFNKDDLRRIGISSGDVHIIQLGQSINLDGLNNLALPDVIDKAQNLTQEQIASIKYNLEHSIR